MMKYLIASTALLASSVAMAEVGNVQVFYDRSVGDGTDEISGFGVQGYGRVAPNVFISGMYQALDGDDFIGADLDELRFGVGVNSTDSEKAGFYGRLEYVKVDIDTAGGDTDGDGFGLHAGVWYAASERLMLNAEIGIAEIEDDENNVASISGSEFSFAASYALTDVMSVFAERRESIATIVGGTETRFGVGFSF